MERSGVVVGLLGVAETRMKYWVYLLGEESRVARVPRVTPAAVSVLDICLL
ncbi:MAG: hypothetical protein NTV52_16275 [Acidobacteria bacterium]|nr:hypothetical protein [Acidobacteriota bacterium]